MRLKLLIGLLFCAGCGVKGKPMPPNSPPVLGRGEPSYSQATKDLPVDAKKKKKIIDDWDEPSDFPEDKDK